MTVIEAVADGLVPQQELQHYGVLGMKWGQHLFGREQVQAKYAQKAYRSSMNKLKKLDYKAEKNESRARRKRDQASLQRDKGAVSLNKGKERKAYKLAKKSMKNQKKAYRAEKRALRAEKKARKLVENMDKVFEGYTLKDIQIDDIRLGRKYCMGMLAELENTYADEYSDRELAREERKRK